MIFKSSFRPHGTNEQEVKTWISLYSLDFFIKSMYVVKTASTKIFEILFFNSNPFFFMRLFTYYFLILFGKMLFNDY